jgi:hypothetical protein
MDGVLLVKTKTERKWKTRYFQLWKNILYMFKGKVRKRRRRRRGRRGT